MHRIDCPTATPDNRFTEGDPTIPVAATTVTADWLNAVQEELVAPILAADMELDKTKTGQLLEAILALVAKRAPLATTARPGLVRPDGTTLTVDEEGTLSAILTDFPIGGIIAFSGTFGGTDNRFPIPLGGSAPNTNWVLCDGTQTNGLAVPDLRGRMILGASDAHQAGDTGGSETHEHSLSGTVGATTLSVGQMPSHTHTTPHARVGSGSGAYAGGGSPELVNWPTGATGGSQPHTHALTNSSSTANNMPPYYALAYIMRIA